MATPEQQLGFYMGDYEVVQQPRFCLNPAQLLGLFFKASNGVQFTA